MQSAPERQSVDLSAYPDLTVVYLGFKVRNLRGLASMMRIGRGLRRIAVSKPEGLLLHENLIFGWGHIGMRQYWRDLESLERFTRSDPHRGWWRDFGRDPSGAGFWHETYRRQGMEAIYLNMPRPVGFAAFAEPLAPKGPFMTARQRLVA